MTRQEIYDKVKAHLLAQKKRSITEDPGSCAYRGVGGLKCAAGALIDDEHYRSDLEGCTCEELSVVAALRRSGVRYTDIDIVRRLQEIHDFSMPRDWKKELESVAKQEGLNP